MRDMAYTRAEVDRAGRGAGWGWFLAWLAVGVCVAAGLAAILSVGLVFLVLAAAAAGLLLRKGPRNAVVGALTGLALPLFYLAYLNRGGPGTVCRSSSGGQTCTDEYTPLPFLIGGVLVFFAGFVIFLMIERRGRGARSPRV
ncbi:xanthine/uracil/vitamin C permease (AzgA family) [Streptomyces turgidiscabies]|uniref:Xanthine/uracil/vitamin C permease (AzgA family) n=2 Tax=Streptomyces turgidiscabies TaxID=85558 RepID=A0ABU0RHH7_9ACTN|nr:xanthine/uracil/vitamin C permease (AzgA family) [Streptomyces turgidiscabies]